MSVQTKMTIEQLIEQVRRTIPFHLSFDGYCEGRCDVCPQKMIEYLDIEISHWESRLKQGISPSDEEITVLARDYERIYRILREHGLIRESKNEGSA